MSDQHTHTHTHKNLTGRQSLEILKAMIEASKS